MKEHSQNWIKHFKANPEFGKYRFKKLEKGFKGYPAFDFDDSILDIVDLETFMIVEKDRIPLFVGTQFGMYPWFYNFPDFYDQEKIVAVLGKSLLSGHITGVSIYKIPSYSRHSMFNKNDKIITFENENYNSTLKTEGN